MSKILKLKKIKTNKYVFLLKIQYFVQDLLTENNDLICAFNEVKVIY